jgi:hypothetical protein
MRSSAIKTPHKEGIYMARTRTTTRSKKPSTKAAKSSARKGSKTSKASKSANLKKAQEARAAKRAEREQAAQEERQDAINAGTLVEGKGGVEFHLIENGKVGDMQSRGAKLISILQKAKAPVSVNELIDQVGGHRVQLNSMLALLRAEDRVRTYRVHTGDRAGGGIAYELTD